MGYKMHVCTSSRVEATCSHTATLHIEAALLCEFEALVTSGYQGQSMHGTVTPQMHASLTHGVTTAFPQ